MKTAVLVARIAANASWKTLAVGDGVDAIKRQFKDIKGSGVLVLEKSVCDVVYYFDSSGQMRRCKLKDPAEIAKLEKANKGESKKQADAKAVAASKSAHAEASAKATAVARKVVGVIKEAVAPKGGGAKPKAAAETKSAAPGQPPAAPAARDAATPPPAAPGAEASDTDPEARFGSPPNEPAK